jgi:hypothetical protein
MLTPEQLCVLSECIGHLDALASMEGQTITISNAMCDMLCDLSAELTRLRRDLTEKGEETPLPGEAVVIKELPVEVPEEKKSLSLHKKQKAIVNYCLTCTSCHDCPLFGLEGNTDMMPCESKIGMLDTFFDTLVKANCITPDGKVIEED